MYVHTCAYWLWGAHKYNVYHCSRWNISDFRVLKHVLYNPLKTKSSLHVQSVQYTLTDRYMLTGSGISTSDMNQTRSTLVLYPVKADAQLPIRKYAVQSKHFSMKIQINPLKKRLGTYIRLWQVLINPVLLQSFTYGYCCTCDGV